MAQSESSPHNESEEMNEGGSNQDDNSNLSSYTLVVDVEPVDDMEERKPSPILTHISNATPLEK